MTAMINDAKQVVTTAAETLSDAQLDSMAGGSFSDFLHNTVEISANIAKNALPALQSII
ncbi:hypothetical protein IMZ29_04220 [Achromobacter sp. GG226]|uniref:hypothetical protein n=1 Tax=Verticiella alkaliphila TaxID=2779529 RepID=UPI001C0C4968|nr:hypothetical protein [Verticiella sp. GG226]MBU4609779.1 hypothetical protein [Verticiella sp. GG226]